MLSACILLTSLIPLGADPGPNTKINQIQVVGTHNSYAQPVDRRLLALADPALEKMFAALSSRMTPAQLELFREEHPNPMAFSDGLRYDHPDLKTQLNAGLRSLELDVNPDPEGGRFLDPAGYRALRAQGATDLAPHDRKGLDQPGFKVLHIPDLDFRSHCPVFRECLAQIRNWSDANPKHIPLFLLIEAKSQTIPLFPQPTSLAPFDAMAFDALDTEILSVFPRNRLVTPDDVRGKFPTLRDAVRAGNWPKLSEARGKVLFLMITANGPAGAQGYLEDHPSLRARVAFLRAASPNDDHAAFLMYDNALVRQAEITEAVKAGYLVRTRADIETYEAKVNDTKRASAAFGSGAQVVSTDFFRRGNTYGTDYVVRLPGGSDVRCNPIASLGCR